MNRVPKVRYARSGDVHIAYQVVGDGPHDLVMTPGALSHLEMQWEDPGHERWYRGLSSFSRLVMFDKRGTGLSDRVPIATMEERMDDLRAVMDDAGIERASLLGVSEGGPLSILFAATYPDRVRDLIVYGSFSRFWRLSECELDQIEQERITSWGQDDVSAVAAPSLAGDEHLIEWYRRLSRAAGSPSAGAALFRMNAQIDVTSVLSTISVPTLVLHRTGDRMCPVSSARHTARHIPGARLVVLPGEDHIPYTGDTDALLAEIQEFLTGSRPVELVDRVLATVLFTDIVGSTERLVSAGDSAWSELLDRHDVEVRRHLVRYRGKEVKTTGDGFLATFDGPARAIKCARAITESLGSLGLRVRSGLHTGECEVRGGDLGGLAVHIAARVAALAGPGEVLVSRTVKDLVAGAGLAFTNRGPHELKGVPEQWELFAVE